MFTKKWLDTRGGINRPFNGGLKTHGPVIICRWNTSDFTPCASPCGLGIQTREVSCIHEVTRGTGNTVAVPNHMCPQPPPVDRQYCNVWDCPVEWHIGDWGKVQI